jgi:hypothetical protein
MLRLVLLIFALVLFVVAAFISPPRVNLVAAGLAFLTAAFLAPSLQAD